MGFSFYNSVNTKFSVSFWQALSSFPGAFKKHPSAPLWECEQILTTVTLNKVLKLTEPASNLLKLTVITLIKDISKPELKCLYKCKKIWVHTRIHWNSLLKLVPNHWCSTPFCLYGLILEQGCAPSSKHQVHFIPEPRQSGASLVCSSWS